MAMGATGVNWVSAGYGISINLKLNGHNDFAQLMEHLSRKIVDGD